jgi:hypothetical protein
MKRNYSTGVGADAKLFTGIEIENTPAKGMKTLFVVGIMEEDALCHLAKMQGCKHIYFGANQSFPRLEVNDAAGWAPWERMIQYCLDQDFWCTLDFDVAQAEGLLESGLVEHIKFIPQISVKLPYLQQLGYNATIKIDDKDFKATNPGVWCVPLHTVTDRQYFTDWSQYGKDEIIA